MKILLLNWRDSTHPKSGGAERVTMEHCLRWVAAGHSVTWFTAWYKGANQEETIDGVTIIRKGGSFTVYLSAAKYLIQKGNSFDVIVDEFHGLPFLAPVLTKRPVVGFIHEVAGEIWDYTFPFPFNVIGKIAERIVFSFYKKCLFWTDADSMMPELVRYGIPKSNITAIPCPLINPPKTGRLYPKEKNPTFIFLNRIVPMKGISDVLLAFRLIQHALPDSQLWIVGSGEEGYVNKLKRLTKEYGIEQAVTWWGKVSEDEKYMLLSKAHILLHASIKEGWGLVVLEAASVGTPTVAYPVTGLIDVVKHEKTGIVCHVKTPESLASWAIQLLNQPKLYAKFQKAGKEWVRSLSWEEVTKQSMTLLRKAQERSK